MPTKVLLSIKPEFAEKIFSGIKRYEFRRVMFKSEGISKIVVYASSPIRQVIGEFEVAEILSLQKAELWKQTKHYSGIRKAHFDDYFRDKDTANAIKVHAPLRYVKPLSLLKVSGSDKPPQSFRYL